MWCAIIYGGIALGFWYMAMFSTEFNFILWMYPSVMGIRLSMLFIFDPIEEFWNYEYVEKEKDELA